MEHCEECGKMVEVVWGGLCRCCGSYVGGSPEDLCDELEAMGFQPDEDDENEYSWS